LGFSRVVNLSPYQLSRSHFLPKKRLIRLYTYIRPPPSLLAHHHGHSHGSIKSCSNHAKYGVNPASIHIPDTAHVGITDQTMRDDIMTEYEPHQNLACNQPAPVVMPSGAKITTITVIDTCDDVHCCYCHGCEYEDTDEAGRPYCVVCGEHREYEE